MLAVHRDVLDFAVRGTPVPDAAETGCVSELVVAVRNLEAGPDIGCDAVVEVVVDARLGRLAEVGRVVRVRLRAERFREITKGGGQPGAFAACTAGWARPLRSYGIQRSENVTRSVLT